MKKRTQKEICNAYLLTLEKELKECEKKGVSKDFIRGKIEGVAILLMTIDMLTFDETLTIIDRIY